MGHSQTGFQKLNVMSRIGRKQALAERRHQFENGDHMQRIARHHLSQSSEACAPRQHGVEDLQIDWLRGFGGVCQVGVAIQRTTSTDAGQAVSWLEVFRSDRGLSLHRLHCVHSFDVSLAFVLLNVCLFARADPDGLCDSASLAICLIGARLTHEKAVTRASSHIGEKFETPELLNFVKQPTTLFSYMSARRLKMAVGRCVLWQMIPHACLELGFWQPARPGSSTKDCAAINF